MPNVRELIHTLRTPLAILEMKLDGLNKNWARLSSDLTQEKNEERDQIDEALLSMSNELMRIEELLDSTKEVKQNINTFFPSTIQNQNRSPYYYFPSSIIYVDDSQVFLAEIEKAFSNRFILETYSDSRQAQSEIKLKPLVADFNKRIFRNVLLEETDQEQPVTEVDISSIIDIARNNNRFNHLSTVIVDFHMPHMNGLQLCEQLKDVSVKKILLTGDADYERAVNAFNRKLIDGFVLKGGSDMLSKLEQTINRLEVSQFLELLEPSTIYSSLPISKKIFVDLFNKWLSDNKVLEYYILNSSGTYLGITADGKTSVLLVQSKDENEFFCESISLHEINNDISRKILSKKYLLGLVNTSEKKLSIDMWKNYIYPASVIEDNNNTYYYSILNNESINRFLGGHNVFSYNEQMLARNKNDK